MKIDQNQSDSKVQISLNQIDKFSFFVVVRYLTILVKWAAGWVVLDHEGAAALVRFALRAEHRGVGGAQVAAGLAE